MIGVAPPRVGSGSNVPAALEAVLVPLRAALDACGSRGPFASVAWGLPVPDDGTWLTLDGFATAEGAAPVIGRYSPDSDFAKLTGHWVFQTTCGTALFAAGYLYAAQQRVPALQGNVLLHNTQWLQHLRFMEPRLWVLPDDPLGGSPGVTVIADHQELTATLFAEIQRTYEPIVRAFRARRQTSVANAWASVVDGLLQGFLLAGRGDTGLDTAWDLWRRTVRSWDVPTRRWPRRLPFAEAGFVDEMVVRAACCLTWTITDSTGTKQKNCPNCPLNIGDDGRVRWMVEWLTQLATEEQAGANRPVSSA
jgi:hypothetical protein